jgi:hypothetical protein
MPAGRGGAAQAVMFGIIGKIKRLDRGLVISALGHFGLLAIGLLYLYLGASAHEAVPPEATLVELVTPQEMPRLSGTPSDLRASGTKGEPTPQPPVRAQNVPPQPEQKPQKQQKDQRAQRDVKPKTPAPPPLRPSETAEVPAPLEEPLPDPPAPAAPPSPEPAASMAERAQLALLGGRLGGGFAAPPIDSPLVGRDYTEQFRQVVSACAPAVPSVDPHETVSVRIRVFLNRDGTVAAAPLMRETNPSAKQQAMMQSFAAGLEKCQPYTMLPQDKYAQWKQLDLVVFPINSYGG